MTDEKNIRNKDPKQDDPNDKKRGPTEQPETDSSGDALDGTGEENHQKG